MVDFGCFVLPFLLIKLVTVIWSLLSLTDEEGGQQGEEDHHVLLVTVVFCAFSLSILVIKIATMWSLLSYRIGE